MKTYVRSIGESVNISDKVKANVIKTMKEAENQIQNDEDSIRLMKRIRRKKKLTLNEIKEEYQRELDKLIQYGIVNLLLNNEVILSGIGEQVLKGIGKSK